MFIEIMRFEIFEIKIFDFGIIDFVFFFEECLL
jgi:hypothetical protein